MADRHTGGAEPPDDSACLDDVGPQSPASPARALLPTCMFLRPCERIPPEAHEIAGLTSIAARYDALTDHLPLVDPDVLVRMPSGTLMVIARLRAEAPWLSTAIDLLEEQLEVALWCGRPWIWFRPMLLVGAPGAGKSHFAQLLGALSGCGTASMNMGGVSEATSIEGTTRGFTSAVPCWPARVMCDELCANPILILEELDKSGGDRGHGDPRAALLSLLEPVTAEHYHDRCLSAEVNVSQCNWVATANSLEGLSAPLLSRFDIVEITGPGEEHFDVLLTNLIRGIAARWQVDAALLPDLHPQAEDALRVRFARHRSARQLGREVAAALGAVLKMKEKPMH